MVTFRVTEGIVWTSTDAKRLLCLQYRARLCSGLLRTCWVFKFVVMRILVLPRLLPKPQPTALNHRYRKSSASHAMQMVRISLCNLSRPLLTPTVPLRQHAIRGNRSKTQGLHLSASWVSVIDKPPEIINAFLMTTIDNNGIWSYIAVPLPTMQ